MWQKIFSSLAWVDIYVAIFLLVVFLLASWLSFYVLKRTVRKLVEKSGTELDNVILDSLEKPVFISIGLFGLFISLLYLPFTPAIDYWISKIFKTVFIVLGVYTGIKVIDAILQWYVVAIASKTKNTLDDRLVPVLRVMVPTGAGIIGILVVLEIYGISILPVKTWLIAHGGRIALIITISVTTLFALSSAVPRMVQIALGKGKAGELPEEIQKRVDTLSGVLVTTGEVLIIVVGVFMLLSEVNLDIAPVLAGAGIVGVAIGFGAQSLIKDIIAGLFIIWDNQYRVGDVVKIADTTGAVEEISLKRTVLRDMDGAVHFVPNGEIRVASNLTRGWSRVNLNVSVGYNEDLSKVIDIINRVGKELYLDPSWSPNILKAPQVLWVDKLGDSGIEIKIIGDTKPLQQWPVMGELRLRLKKTFDEQGIEIPWPHTKVYFGNSPFPMDSKENPGQKSGKQ